MRKLWLLNLLAVVPALAVQGDFSWSGRLKEGQSIEIKGVNGGIRADYTSGSEVQITARKSAWRSDPNSVSVQAVPHEGGVTVCAVYPGDGGRPNECRPGEGGRMQTRDNDTKVEFTVKTPKGVRLIAKTVNGSITITALQSDVDAHTVNGKINLSTTGVANAHTVNGGIEASIGNANWSDRLEFTTVNGGIELTVPAGLNAEVSAATVNGGMSTDFPLTVSGRWGPKSLRGRIGSGGRQLKLSTVNGGIQLRSSTGRAI
ncbi:MAG: hypothetical protein JSU00_11390 [Acidobacteria bacterium]|nr:hypothetical protein [Acidobacteriota bacterium]